MKPRVLVLDASLTVRMDLAETLAADGFDATLVPTTEEASAQLASGGFDLAILDAMPDGSGLQLVEHLRARPATADLPIVLLSDDEVEAPVDERLAKPWSRERLSARVKELAVRRRPSADTPRATILAVDDSPTFLEWLASNLRDDGYEIVTARSGEEALERIGERRFDAVLLDVEMPGLSGHDTSRRIKSTPEWRSIPVIILTAHDDRDAMIEGINAGADDWVAKTSELDILRARLRAQVRRRRFEAENARMREELHHTRLAATEARAARRVAEARAELVEEVRRKNAELRRRNEELRELSRQNRLILESAAEGICGLDRDGRITFANAAAAQMLGLPLDDLRGRVLHDVAHAGLDDRHEASECRFLDPVRTGEPRSEADHCFHRGDGVRLPIDYVSSPMFDDDAVVVGVGVLFRDVSARRALEEQLRHAQKMEVVGRLAGGVAHDFNNLLTAIQGYGSVLAMKLGADDPRREFADQILASCKRAASLTRQLLAFSRRQVVVPKQVDPNELVHDMGSMLEQLIGDHIGLDFELDARGEVRVDPGQLEQVVLNLVLNARDAMPGGGRVVVATRDTRISAQHPGGPAPGDWLVLTVRDEGEGIPEDVREHIFEPFFTTRASGTGLGLSTVHGIVAQSAGVLELQSTVGEGTAFHVWLPRLAPVQEAEPRPLAPGGETVLVVDDQEAIRAFVAAVLEEGGYEVLVASDGLQALSVFAERDRPVDLLVTDVVMPEMSGQELAAQLRDRFRGLRVLFMSGYTAGITIPPNISEGADFLPKPFSADDLLARVRALLDQQRHQAASRRATT